MTTPLLNHSLFFYFIILLPGTFLFSQDITTNKWQVDSLIIINQQYSEFHFPPRHLYQEQTLRIFKNNYSLYQIQDYLFENSRLIRFVPPLSVGDTLRISYNRYPFNLKTIYTLFKRDTLDYSVSDSTNKDSSKVRIIPAALTNPFDDFGSGLQKSGSIMRGVSVGSNRDLTLNSGLNLELSGNLTENVEIIAALTDESTPIQPEGNTQTLEEVDQVFVQFKSPFVDGTVGDFNMRLDGTEFSNFSRKLTGLTLLGKYENHFAGATIATSRGFFNRVNLLGQEGNQGPYQLTGKDGEREIIVLAGTENVWVNGKKILRGESNDYIIEYGDGQISFTNKLLITSESRIEIDFEYFPAIQKFSRSAFGGLAGGTIFNNTLKYKINFYQEKDNTDQAIGEEENLSSEEKEILRLAGDDFSKASINGATFVGDNNGRYITADTVLNNLSYTIFRYSGKSTGNYNVVFTYVGYNKGAYVRDRLGQYRWVGPGEGDYEPIKLIPLPQKQQLADINLHWKAANNVEIISEYAFSNFDKNVFSQKANSDNYGNAFHLNAEVKELKPYLSGYKLGTFNFGLDSRIINENFQSMDRYNQPDFQRYWNILSDQKSSNQEKSIQLSSQYKPIEELSLSLNAGSLSKKDLESFRYAALLNFDKKNLLVTDINVEHVQSDVIKTRTKNNWDRLNVSVLKDIWYFQPQLLYDFEKRVNINPLLTSGFRFDDYGLKISLLDWHYFKGYTQFNKREDKVFDVEEENRLVRQSATNTQRYKFELDNIRETSASFEFVTRKKDFTPRFENIKLDSLKLIYADASVQDTVWQDRSTNLAELQITHSHWEKALNLNLQYRISTEQTALREKVYINVEQGRGNFRFDQEIDEYVPDPDGDYVLFVLPSGKFEPVTNIESALRLAYDPSRYWKKPKKGWQSLLSNLSGSSYFRIEEETKEKDLQSIYLLSLDKFQGEKTLRGTLVYDQDLFIMKKNRQLNFRLNYSYRDDLFNQFLDANDNEDKLTIEKGIRTDWKISTNIKSQSELIQKITERLSKSNPLRDRDINSYVFSQRFTYKPFSSWEHRLNLEYGDEKNKSDNYPLNLWFGVAKLESNYIVAGQGRVTADYEYQVVNVYDNPLKRSVPFEMARGKKDGISKKWQLRAEYTFSKNILFTLLYRGRDEAGFSNIIHTGQAEVRAFF